MNTHDVIYSIKKMSMDKVDIRVEYCEKGYWINPLNQMWIEERFFISIKKNQSINHKILNQIISKINSESLKSNKEVLLCSII